MWQQHQAYESLVNQACGIGCERNPVGRLSLRMKSVMAYLKKLNADYSIDISLKVATLQREMGVISKMLYINPFNFSLQQDLVQKKYVMAKTQARFA